MNYYFILKKTLTLFAQSASRLKITQRCIKFAFTALNNNNNNEKIFHFTKTKTKINTNYYIFSKQNAIRVLENLVIIFDANKFAKRSGIEKVTIEIVRIKETFKF